VCTVETQRPIGDFRRARVLHRYELELSGLLDMLDVSGLPCAPPTAPTPIRSWSAGARSPFRIRSPLAAFADLV